MRQAAQLLQYFQKQNLLNKPFNRSFDQARNIHRPPPKKLEKVHQKKSECVEPCEVSGKSIWNMFSFRNKKKPAQPKENVPKKRECETVEFVTEEQAAIDMEKISKMGGQAYRTCGTGYILQKDYYDQTPETSTNSSEEHILEEMMKDPSLKGQCDPMPEFQSAALKLIELNERKLHPLYKKLMSIPKRPRSQTGSGTSTMPHYKSLSGPVLPEEFPAHLKINREQFEKKNILYEYKRAEPPQQMLVRMVEMKYNEKPQLKKAENRGSKNED